MSPSTLSEGELTVLAEFQRALSREQERPGRSAIEFRRVQARFHERGQAAWENYLRTGKSVPAAEVIAELQAKSAAARQAKLPATGQTRLAAAKGKRPGR